MPTSRKPPLVTNDPRILRSPLTNRWYIVTKWRPSGPDNIEAHTKFDVTDRVESIIAAAKEGDL